MRYHRYKDVQGYWRWRLIAANNEIIAVSSEGYVTLASCDHSIGLVKASSHTPVV